MLSFLTLINLTIKKAIYWNGKHSVTRKGFSYCSITCSPASSHGDSPQSTYTHTPILRQTDRNRRKNKEILTWVRWEKSAAFAVNDLLHSRHVWRDGGWDYPQAWHHGVDWRDSSHHPKSRIKI